MVQSFRIYTGLFLINRPYFLHTMCLDLSNLSLPWFKALDFLLSMMITWHFQSCFIFLRLSFLPFIVNLLPFTTLHENIWNNQSTVFVLVTRKRESYEDFLYDKFSAPCELPIWLPGGHDNDPEYSPIPYYFYYIHEAPSIRIGRELGDGRTQPDHFTER